MRRTQLPCAGVRSRGSVRSDGLTETSLRRVHPRRGALFHYYMMYLFLTSILMTSAGLCIHAILKADRLDAEVSQQLKLLLRLDDQLREDCRAGSVVENTETRLVVDDSLTAGQRMEWVVEDHTLVRTTLKDQQVRNSAVFVFRKGSSLSFHASNEHPEVVLTIEEPSSYEPSSSDNSSKFATVNRLQMILPLRTSASLQPEVNDADSEKISDSSTEDAASADSPDSVDASSEGDTTAISPATHSVLLCHAIAASSTQKFLAERRGSAGDRDVGRWALADSRANSLAGAMA